MAFLRLRGISIVAYLDDLLLFAPSAEQLTRDLEFTKDFLRGLGWLLNFEKSHLVPSQCITYLGYLLDSRQQRIFLPQEKVHKIEDAMRLLQDNQLVSIRRVMSSLGLLTSAIPAVQWAGLHFCPLQTFILKSSLDALVNVPPQVKRSVWWWRATGNLSQGWLWVVPVAKVVTTDTSGRGWGGGHLGPLKTQGSWKEEELQRSMN